MARPGVPDPEETQFPGLKDDEVGTSPPPPGGRPPPASRGAQSVPGAGRYPTDEPAPILVPERTLRVQTRRDFLLYGAGAVAAAAGFWWALPEDTQQRLGARHARDTPAKERLLNKSLHWDDDVAEALYSPSRLVPVYDKALAQSPEKLRNNYDGPTPEPGYLQHWSLTVKGLASGRTERLGMADIAEMTRRYGRHEEVTRLVCVEGWSAIAWWSGLRLAHFMQALPPMPGARWARLDSSVNLDTDADGNPIPDPYYVAIDLPTARHPQTLLATHQSDRPLTVEHGAPLRLIAPMKLGLKNIKAITAITYTAEQPADYWNRRGYSQYDGL